MRCAALFVLSLLVGCGSPEAQAPSPPTPALPAAPPTPAANAEPAAEPPATETAPPVAEVPPTEPAPATGPAEEELDLLHAITTRVAVSTVYRDDASQVARLVDGDPETAWNSRSGDLTGAFIEIDVPRGATVRAIAMTTGFTHTTPRADLFTGNHRVSRVRISRDGTSLGEHDLDTSSRELVEVPVSGPGGRIRIEVLATLAGERSDWREICISELRVLGTAPGARAGSTSPVISVGALTGALEVAEAAADEAQAAADEAQAAADEAQAAADEAEDAEDARRIAELDMEAYEEDLADWPIYVVALAPSSDGGSEETATQAELELRERLHEERQRIFTAAATHLEASLPERAAELRRRGLERAALWAGRHADLDALLAAGEALYPENRRCHLAALRARIRVQTAAAIAEALIEELDVWVDIREDWNGNRLNAARIAELRGSITASRAFSRWLTGMRVADWEDLPAARRQALLEGTTAPPTELSEDWARARSEIERAQQACSE